MEKGGGTCRFRTVWHCSEYEQCRGIKEGHPLGRINNVWDSQMIIRPGGPGTNVAAAMGPQTTELVVLQKLILVDLKDVT